MGESQYDDEVGEKVATLLFFTKISNDLQGTSVLRRKGGVWDVKRGRVHLLQEGVREWETRVQEGKEGVGKTKEVLMTEGTIRRL